MSSTDSIQNDSIENNVFEVLDFTSTEEKNTVNQINENNNEQNENVHSVLKKMLPFGDTTKISSIDEHLSVDDQTNEKLKSELYENVPCVMEEEKLSNFTISNNQNDSYHCSYHQTSNNVKDEILDLSVNSVCDMENEKNKTIKYFPYGKNFWI